MKKQRSHDGVICTGETYKNVVKMTFSRGRPGGPIRPLTAIRSWWRPCWAGLSTVVLLVSPLIGAPLLCAQTAAADSAAIHQVGREFSAAFMRGDAAAMTDLYTSDAVIFPERSERISGREAIERYWKLRPGRRVTRHVLTPARIMVDGNHAYDYGTYEIAGERDGTPWGPLRGKYVVVWRRDQGSWRMQLDIWNSGPEPGS